MEIICIENDAFFKLVEEVLSRIKQKNNIVSDKWISGEEAMRKLRITSKSTLQKLRDNGKITFSQPQKKIILYDADSIQQFLEKHNDYPSFGITN